jgi:hypothetical protein
VTRLQGAVPAYAGRQAEALPATGHTACSPEGSLSIEILSKDTANLYSSQTLYT